MTLFVGTLFFGFSLVDALIGDLTIAQEHRLVWSLEVVGCVLFLVSGAFVRPATGDALAVGVANWGTLTGALCFAIAGVIQEFEHPKPPPTVA